MSGIRIENLCKSFGDFDAVKNASFAVEEGELVALLGPSGSGKSTILRMIAGLENADSGRICLTGKDVTTIRTQNRRVGFVFQHYALFRHMTVFRNIAFGLEIQKRPAEEIRSRVEELIDLVKLHGHEHHYPAQLSGGQRQRVALARALAPEPRVLLLDEPFGALDAKVRKNLAKWLRDLHDRIHVTSVFVTHDQSEAMEIADKIVVINRGCVEQVGTPIQVYEVPHSRFVASFVGQVNVLEAFMGNGKLRIAGTDTCIPWPDSADTDKCAVVMLVRPEEIEISPQASPSTVSALVSAVQYRGSHYEVEMMLGQNQAKCMVPRNRMAGAALAPGKEVELTLGDFQLFSAEEGHQSVRRMLSSLGYIE
ncbi:MAG: ABC transporter ATP-binding protein [Candidatus Aminicenantes bacterium]|nr:ABC transporter ATP-binding protein [Candidatus Aminicenantes bacterium]